MSPKSFGSTTLFLFSATSHFLVLYFSFNLNLKHIFWISKFKKHFTIPPRNKTLHDWACEVAWISCWPSEPATRVRIPAGPSYFSSVGMVDKTIKRVLLAKGRSNSNINPKPPFSKENGQGICGGFESLLSPKICEILIHKTIKNPYSNYISQQTHS